MFALSFRLSYKYHQVVHVTNITSVLKIFVQCLSTLNNLSVQMKNSIFLVNATSEGCFILRKKKKHYDLSLLS